MMKLLLLSLALCATTQVKLPAGKYSCTASKYRNGSYEFIGRGSLTLLAGGKYSYQGFEKPSTGTYTSDAKGNLAFKGGYLNGGQGEKFKGENRFFLTFPANPDHRWTCTLQSR